MEQPEPARGGLGYVGASALRRSSSERAIGVGGGSRSTSSWRPLRCERPGGNPVFQNIGAVSATEELLAGVYRGLGRIPSAPIRRLAGPGVDGSNRPLPVCQATVIGLCRLLAAYAYVSHPFFLAREAY